MARITFITQDGEEITVEATSGNVMELAVANGVSGILGDCGGVCSCATCHVQVAEADIAKTGYATQVEQDMLEFQDNSTEYSRLSCQLEVSDALDGITLKVCPEEGA